MSAEKYNSALVLEAWKRAVNTGVIDETVLRPEIARSWKRCLEAELDPWSMNQPPQDLELLRSVCDKYAEVLQGFEPVLQYLVAVFNSNASLANKQGFVFRLLTPLANYPRTLGTFCAENTVGTGNITVAIHENKPYRVDGYEHFRAYSQSYSGVAAPVNGLMGEDFVLCINNPHVPLPENALSVCITAAELAAKLCRSRRETFMHLSSACFFDPIIQSDSALVIVTDPSGNILTANEAAKHYLPGYEKQPYGSVSLSKYLKDKADLTYLIDGSFKNNPRPIAFKGAAKGSVASLSPLRSRKIELINGTVHNVLVFEKTSETKPETEPDRAAVMIPNYIGESDEWKVVDTLVRRVAPFNANVMILGDTGTGKEVVAQALHRLSGRKGEFVAINCGGLPRELLSSELFGYESGAFTGASSSGSMGKFEFANGGTLFLDEIGDMPVDMQVSLLRVIQEQRITRVGANKSIPIDVRIIAATNQDVKKLIDAHRFRADLWYRLSTIEIRMPRLRERQGDVPLLAGYFNEQFSRKLNIPVRALSTEVMDALDCYPWPGNVRELRNVIEKSLIIAGDAPLAPEHLPEEIRNCVRPSPVGAPPLKAHAAPTDDAPTTPKLMREKKEREKIIRVLQEEKGNISRAAKVLNMSRNTLYRKIQKMDIRIEIFAVGKSGDTD